MAVWCHERQGHRLGKLPNSQTLWHCEAVFLKKVETANSIHREFLSNVGTCKQNSMRLHAILDNSRDDHLLALKPLHSFMYKPSHTFPLAVHIEHKHAQPLLNYSLILPIEAKPVSCVPHKKQGKANARRAVLFFQLSHFLDLLDDT